MASGKPSERRKYTSPASHGALWGREKGGGRMGNSALLSRRTNFSMDLSLDRQCEVCTISGNPGGHRQELCTFVKGFITGLVQRHPKCRGKIPTLEKKMAAIRNKMSTGSNSIPTIAHTHCCVLDIGADSTFQDHLLMKLKEGRGELTQI